MRRSSVLILILAVVLLFSSCGGSDRSKSVADAESYDELTMDYDEADDEDYDEGAMLEQSYLDAMDHWEMNQPWPKPEK